MEFEWDPEKMRAPRTWVPMHLRDGFTRYVVQGIPTGSGMRSILEDRPLSDVLPHLDETAEQHVGSIYRFLYNAAPGECFGSPEKVKAWIARGGIQGRTPAPPAS